MLSPLTLNTVHQRNVCMSYVISKVLFLDVLKTVKVDMFYVCNSILDVQSNIKLAHVQTPVLSLERENNRSTLWKAY